MFFADNFSSKSIFDDDNKKIESKKTKKSKKILSKIKEEEKAKKTEKTEKGKTEEKKYLKFVSCLNNEKFILLFFVIYYFGRIGNNTAFITQYPMSDKIFQLFRMTGAAFFVLSFLRIMKMDFGNGILFRENRKKISFLLIITLIISLVANMRIQGGYTFLTDILMAYVLAHIPLKKNFEFRTVLFFVICLIIPSLCAVGLLDNLVTGRGNTVRYALGFDYTTRISGIYGFATLYYCAMKKFDLEWRDIFMMVFSSLLIDFLTDTRTYFYLELAFGIICVFMRFYKIYKKKEKNTLTQRGEKVVRNEIKTKKYSDGTEKKFIKTRKDKDESFFNTLIKVLKHAEKIFVYIFPAFSVITLALTLGYGYGGVFLKLDSLLSHRLSQVYADCVNYGIHAFGHNFALYGNGGAHVDITSTFGSNFIDSGFLQLLMIRGFVPFVLIVIMAHIALVQLYECEMHTEVFIFFTVTVLSTFSSGLMSNESVLFILMFYGLRLFSTGKMKKKV